jgi:GNAT superfamily N-acetyltransferase
VTRIRPYREEDTEAIVAFSLRAWEPVHASFEQTMGPAVFHGLYGSDWRDRQEREIRHALAQPGTATWVADVDSVPVGFAVAVLKPDEGLGAIWFLAVDPNHQNRGIGTMLTDTATHWIAGAGMPIAAISTGADAAHAPGRRVYEKAGYTPVPAMNYFKAL